MKNQKKLIFIVDDHPIVRHGLGNLLNDTEDLSVCGETGEAKAVIPLLDKLRPNLVIVDLFLHGVIALDLIKKIHERFSDLPILALSIQNEAFFAERALRAGADGYVVKEETTNEILDAIHVLLEDGVYVSKKLVDKLSFTIKQSKDASGPEFVDKLSNRELQVFQLIGEGANIRQIADDLELSAKTVETHCARIKKKLNLQNANELVRHASQYRSDLSTR